MSSSKAKRETGRGHNHATERLLWIVGFQPMMIHTRKRKSCEIKWNLRTYNFDHGIVRLSFRRKLYDRQKIHGKSGFWRKIWSAYIVNIVQGFWQRFPGISRNKEKYYSHLFYHQHKSCSHWHFKNESLRVFT